MPYKDPATKLEYAKQYRLKKKAEISARDRDYREKNKEAIAEYQRTRRLETVDTDANRLKEYNSRPESKVKRAERRKRNWAEDPQYRMASRLRNRLWYALRGKMGKHSAIRLLGCSVSDAVLHISRKFEAGMFWDNRREWHIDHIIPLSAFDLEDAEQVAKACHYTNLRPLWARENLSKGSRIES